MNKAGNAIRNLVDLGIGKLLFFIDDGDLVRGFFIALLKQIDYRFALVIRNLGLVETVKHGKLLLAHKLDLAELFFFEELFYYRYHRVSKRADDFLPEQIASVIKAQVEFFARLKYHDIYF